MKKKITPGLVNKLVTQQKKKPTAKDKIMKHLSNLSGANSSQYLQSLRKSVAQETDTSIKPLYRTPQLGYTSIFMAESSLADTVFKSGRYAEAPDDSEDWVRLPNVSDKFRGSAGLFWTNKSLQLGQADVEASNWNKGTALSYMNNVTDSITEQHIPMKIHFSSLAPPHESDDGSTREWLLIEGNNHFSEFSSSIGQLPAKAAAVGRVMGSSVFPAEAFHTHLLHASDNTRTQFDHTMTVVQFSKKEKIETKYGDVLHGYADIHGDYNYFDSQYEPWVSERNVATEPVLPNMYVFFAYQDSENPNPSFKHHLSLGGKINLANHTDMFSSQASRRNAQVAATPSEKYFSEWSRVYSKAVEDATTFHLGRKFQNIMLSTEDIATLATYEANKEMFPMWMHVEFTTDKMTEFAEALKDSQLMGMLQQDLMQLIRGNALPAIRTFEAKALAKPVLTAENIRSPEAEPPQKLGFQNANRRVFNLDRWMNSYMSTDSTDSSNVGSESVFSTFLGTYNSTNQISNDPKYDFYKSLMAIILKGKIKKLLRKHTRTVQEVFEGKPCYHETVLYKISKYAGDKATGQPIQSIYVPNSNDIDIFKYIDTQVKYKKQYTYTIRGYELVVGNKYLYEDVVSKVEYGKWAAVRVKNTPSLRLVEVPLYIHTNRVLDNPPIHPEVEFVPYKGIGNRIKILMNSGIGRYELPYEIIESSELAQVKRHQRAQNILHTENTLKYETDDYPAFYEVRRIDYKPKSYSDFSNKVRHTVTTSLANTDLISSGIAIDDKICSNKKYYYCIRAIDNHGHISYPSPIYEVEMVDDHGSIFPIVKLCEFAPEFESQPSIGGRRYMHVLPAMPQMIINEEASGLLDAATVANLKKLTLGISEESVWGKKIKIRLTSKSTGRKMDFNITFNHKYLKQLNRD